MIELLLWTTPLGLLVDIGGFALVIRYGQALFIRSGTGPADDSVGKDGDLYLQHGGSSDECGEKRRRFRAHVGVGVVFFGFGLQIVGAAAAIYLTV